MLESHVQVCKFVPCPRECRDPENKIKLISRINVESHEKEHCPNRDYTCQHCAEKGAHARITQVHDKVCGKKPVPCPNPLCEEQIERDVVSHHVDKECGYTVISCKYQDIGCDTKLKRHDMPGHEEGDDRTHLHFALGVVTALKKTVSLLEEKVATTLKQGESMVLRVTDFEHKRRKNGVFKSSPFYTSANGYCMAIQVHVNGCGYGRGTHVSIYTRILQGRNDRELNWPFVGTLSIVLLNQLEDDNHHVKKVKQALQSFDVETGTTRGCAKFVSHSQLAYDPVKNTQYLREDTVYLRVSVEVTGVRLWLE